ncbi:MAG TPA: hypothetical protein ENN07_02925 [candidate division Zixibacteria bacterium]|nr:hypothetical protein [candidate division Zixibacteria bacterium]
MTIEDKMVRRRKRRIPFIEAIITGVLLGVVIIFFAPRCQPPPAEFSPDYNISVTNPQLDFVIDSLSRRGYAIQNNFPAYVRLYKAKIDGDPRHEAVEIAKTFKAHTGENVQIQLDFEGGRYFAHPERGIITPVVK